MLDDLPFMTAYIQSRMLRSLKTAENDLILNGSSDTNPVSGIADLATAYSGDYADAVRRVLDAAYGQIPEDTNNFYNPTTIVMRPRRAVEIGLNQADGSGEFDLPQGSVAFGNGRLSLGGLQTVTTSQVGAQDFYAFDKNALMFIRRMAPELRMFEDATLAKKNKIMFRIEERATLIGFNNAAIVSGTLPVVGS
jgi:HK97 family phage major capsid protein